MIGIGLVQPLPSPEADILHGLLHDRIRELWKQRDLHKRMSGGRRRGCPECAETMAELRTLNRLARQARRQAEADTVWRLGRAPVAIPILISLTAPMAVLPAA